MASVIGKNYHAAAGWTIVCWEALIGNHGLQRKRARGRPAPLQCAMPSGSGGQLRNPVSQSQALPFQLREFSLPRERLCGVDQAVERAMPLAQGFEVRVSHSSLLLLPDYKLAVPAH